VRKRLRQTFQSVFTSDSSLGVYNSFDIVGDIAIIKLPNSYRTYAPLVAAAIMSKHKNVKTVLAQLGGIAGDHRTRRLVHVAGENRFRTIHKESGCMFVVDLESCYFSPRLSYERRRIAQLVNAAEIVVNMFAGVGCFSILIAKQVPITKIYSIDINPAATQFMEENIKLNGVYGKVISMLGDSKLIIETQLQGVADRVLMPLPEKALEYLPVAISALKPTGGWIHYHSFEHAAKGESPIEKAKQKIVEKLSIIDVDFEVSLLRVARRVGPNWHQIVADIHINRY
jgi:tRNA (guanine37-N1)-methyltransferase